jgi:hypothetical protein
MNRLLRRIAALVALAALAFGQVAVAAHACTGEMARSHAMDGMPCEQTMPAGNLCERHCDYGAAASDSQGTAPAVNTVAPALLPWRIADASPFLPTKATARPFERSIERPPLIRFSVLRI